MGENKATDLLIACAHECDGITEKLVQKLSKRDYPNGVENIAADYERIKKDGFNYITMLDDKFPEFLKKQAFYPPVVLFYAGNLELLADTRKKMAVIPGRHHYALENMDALLEGGHDMDTIFVLSCVSTKDTLAIQRLLEWNRNTPLIIAVPDSLTVAFRNSILSEVIKRGGLVVTISPTLRDIPASTETCILKNRLLAQIADSVLIISSTRRDTTNMLVSYALTMAKDILVVPHDIADDDGNNALIYEGAVPIYSHEQLIEYLKGGR